MPASRPLPTTNVVVEAGTRRVFASAVDWPGWCRSAKDEDGALEALASYARRYAEVARTARTAFPLQAAVDPDGFKVLERLPGNATTDFGAPGAVARFDGAPLSTREAVRIAELVAGAWAVFDAVVAAAPATLRKGPRGGGRDRDPMVDHVLAAESSYARKLGLRLSEAAVGDDARVDEGRRAMLAVLRVPSAGSPVGAKGWPVRYGARRIAWHVLDHAWEIEDRS